MLAEHPVGAWEQYITDLLAAAGGITGRAPRADAPAAPANRRLFAVPYEAARDQRFKLANREAGMLPQGVDAAAERQREFESYSQEMLAAETIALVIYLSPGMPWEFVYNSARHCSDETRHCKLGIDWLAQHGLDYTQVPQNTRIYAWRSQYDAATETKTLPDVINWASPSWAPKLFHLGLLLDVSDIVTKNNSQGGGLYEPAIRAVTDNGKQFAVPTHSATEVFYVRREIRS